MSRRFRDSQFDAALQADSDSLLPSSGFAESVMTAVQSDALTPPRIPFPWKRALPGLAANLVMLAALISALVSAFRAGQNFPAGIGTPQAMLRLILRVGSSADAAWLLLTVVLASACLVFTCRMASER